MKTNIITALVYVVLTITLFGCGTANQCTPSANNSCPAANAASTTSSSGTALDAQTKYVTFEGYITPLNITVDNVTYTDSEDFYTHEKQRLTADAAKSYPAYTLFFDANVGLQNFKQGISVFLVASSDAGVASESTVDGNGKFSFNLVADSVNKTDLYTIRADKRVSVRMVDGEDEIKLCYNLYSEVDSTLTTSIILRKFVTTPTEYNCVANSTDGGIQLPANPASGTTAADKAAVKQAAMDAGAPAQTN